MVYRTRSIGIKALAGRAGWLRDLQVLFLPLRCVVCGTTPITPVSPALPEEGRNPELCAACLALLPWNLHACGRCGLPLTGESADLTCGRCLRHAPAYDRAWCAFEYAYPLAHLIRRCKYGGALPYTRVLGGLLAHYLQQQSRERWPECFIPVPLHPLRYRSRGYNQVIELGRWLEHELHVVMRTDLVERSRNTPEQAGLPHHRRRKNLHRAFSVTTAALPSHVALLDDVMTTGSTLNELAKTLRTAGVRHIEAWSLARVAFNVRKGK